MRLPVAAWPVTEGVGDSMTSFAMNDRRKLTRRVGAAVGLVACLVGGGAAAQGALAMLDRFQPGRWEIRQRDAAGAHTEQFCMSSGRRLIQIRHPGEACQSFTIEDGASAVTVQYTCAGSGYGRTRVRFENAGLAQVETQGVAKGLPFEFSAEARRIGNCP